MFWLICARGLFPETFIVSFSRTNHRVNKRGRQKERVKILLNFTYLHKRNQDKNLLGISRIFLKISTRQMFSYPGLNASLNTSRFGGDMAFSDRQIRPRLA